ncbi:MAG: 4-hydroxy-3-methylbut-2-en-1-yl diphosphate synthase [Candidatus Riflebacteria bacterium HGW-Riflebacteria-1]|nr:MAG: 4-hydroxy-3-methylbut-2-en-1-yl diphosphate synthase [Candidatus Riflebacteria bacterium HGW-Riflebacteria-1]
MNHKPTGRRKSRQIMVGRVAVGGNAPVSVQSMTKTDTRDVAATLDAINHLRLAGCDIIRLAVPDAAAAKALKDICSASPIPVIADIHFDHQLAIDAIRNGVHGLRINPGNIRSEEKVREVIAAATDWHVPIRVGVNAGSLDPAIKLKYGGVTAAGLAESALNEVKRLEKYGFELIKIAVKAFDLHTMCEAVRITASSCDYPLHLGVTEAGLPEDGIVRSAMGIGSLLLQGIGDTIRVSLTGDSALEVITGLKILQSAGLRSEGPVIVSCPTCGRCQIPLQEIARQVHQRLAGIKESFQVAVMGCAVNGPGEAEQADFGIAGGKESGLIFKHGKVVKSLPMDQLVDGLIEEIFTSLQTDKKGEKK